MHAARTHHIRIHCVFSTSAIAFVASPELKEVRRTLEDIKAARVPMNTLGNTIVSILQVFDARGPHLSDPRVKAKSEVVSTKITNEFWVCILHS